MNRTTWSIACVTEAPTQFAMGCPQRKLYRLQAASGSDPRLEVAKFARLAVLVLRSFAMTAVQSSSHRLTAVILHWEDAWLLALSPAGPPRRVSQSPGSIARVSKPGARSRVSQSPGLGRACLKAPPIIVAMAAPEAFRSKT